MNKIKVILGILLAMTLLVFGACKGGTVTSTVTATQTVTGTAKTITVTQSAQNVTVTAPAQTTTVTKTVAATGTTTATSSTSSTTTSTTTGTGTTTTGGMTTTVTTTSLAGPISSLDGKVQLTNLSLSSGSFQTPSVGGDVTNLSSATLSVTITVQFIDPSGAVATTGSTQISLNGNAKQRFSVSGKGMALFNAKGFIISLTDQ